MESFYALALIAGILVAFVFPVLIATYHNTFKVEIPPDVDQPSKLRLYHWVYTLMEVLAKNLESLGILEEHILIRLISDGLPTCRDSKLFIKDLHFDEVPVRIYLPRVRTASKQRGVIFFHGGCGMFGNIRSYERTCRYIARKSDSVVVSVGYRLAPEHPYPTQFEDCLTATIHFMRTAQDYGVDPSRIIICGDSSGGTLTAAVAQALVNRRDLPKLRAQILIYPYLQCVDFNLPSYQQNKGVPILLKERTVALGLRYLNKDLSVIEAVFKGCHIPEDLQLKYQKWVSPDYIPHEFKTRGYKPSTTHPLFSEEVYTLIKPMLDPVFSPLLAEDSVIARLPETFILTCEFDVLRDDGLLYKKRLEDHGIKVTWCHLQEGFHGTVTLPLSKMAVIYTLLVLFLAVFVAGFILLVMGAINFDFSNSEIPPGVNQPVKLRILHIILISTAVVGKILENIGICSQVSFVRYMQSRKTLGLDPKLFIKDLCFEKVPVRIYQPKVPSASQRRGVMFFHGGGWVFGSLETHEKLCRSIARESESVVVSVGYRLAPEHKYPAAYEDCLNATIHFMKNTEHYSVDPANVIVCGDSAGGNLAAAVSQTLAGRSDLPKLRAQILIYPGLQALDFNLPSYQQNRGVPLLFRERAAFYVLQYLNGDALHMQEVLEGSHIPIDIILNYRKWVSPDNIPEKFKVRGYKPHVLLDCTTEVYETVKRFCEPNLCPLLAEDAIVHQLPESFILTCEYDVLRDDGLLYKKRLEDNGVRVTWYHLEDGFHGVINSFNSDWLSFSSGKRGLDNIVNFLKSL
ncbi:arylacetamide deacetylase-like 4 [Pluvialis apricaria]